MAIVSLYRVSWFNARHNAANAQVQATLVVAAAGTDAASLASTIKTNNADNQNVTVTQVQVVQAGIVQ